MTSNSKTLSEHFGGVPNVPPNLLRFEEDDATLINELFDAMAGEDVDYTQFFRTLADAAQGQDATLLALLNDQGAGPVACQVARTSSS